MVTALMITGNLEGAGRKPFSTVPVTESIACENYEVRVAVLTTCFGVFINVPDAKLWRFVERTMTPSRVPSTMVRSKYLALRKQGAT